MSDRLLELLAMLTGTAIGLAILFRLRRRRQRGRRAPLMAQQLARRAEQARQDELARQGRAPCPRCGRRDCRDVRTCDAMRLFWLEIDQARRAQQQLTDAQQQELETMRNRTAIVDRGWLEAMRSELARVAAAQQRERDLLCPWRQLDPSLTEEDSPHGH